jgi:hypothetical protein
MSNLADEPSLILSRTYRLRARVDARARDRFWPDPEAPTAGPAGPLTEVDLPCRRNEWHGSF